ncbi:hypothetical protein ABK040_001940 [Willaertia magna]
MYASSIKASSNLSISISFSLPKVFSLVLINKLECTKSFEFDNGIPSNENNQNYYQKVATSDGLKVSNTSNAKSLFDFLNKLLSTGVNKLIGGFLE